MSTTITVPDNYGYVILTCVVGQFVASQMCASMVMKARSDFNVQYPNLYAVPGLHKEADKFNRIQRGHQAMFETLGTYSLCALIGGLKYPITSSVFSVLYNVGSVLYAIGYGDPNLDVKMARYKKGGGLKWVGFLGSLGTMIAAVGKFNKWW